MGNKTFFYSFELFEKHLATKIFTKQSSLILTFKFIKLSEIAMTNFMCIAGNKKRFDKLDCMLFFSCVFIVNAPISLKNVQNDLSHGYLIFTYLTSFIWSLTVFFSQENFLILYSINFKDYKIKNLENT